MSKKNQSNRLTRQHKSSNGVVGIFGSEAKLHDMTVRQLSHIVLQILENKFIKLEFRYRDSIKKEEINEALKKLILNLVKPYLYLMLILYRMVV